MAAAQADELRLRLPVFPVDIMALGTFLGSVSRFYQHDGNTVTNRLVCNERAELIESPGVSLGFVLFSDLYLVEEILQVLQRQSPTKSR